jgi:hypothetical protein
MGDCGAAMRLVLLSGGCDYSGDIGHITHSSAVLVMFRSSFSYICFMPMLDGCQQ